MKQLIKDRRLEAEIFKNCSEFFDLNPPKNPAIFFNNISLSSGAYDLKILFLPNPIDTSISESDLKKLERHFLPKLKFYLAKRLSTRNIPKISFSLDKNELAAIKVKQVLEKIKVEKH